VTQEKTAVPLTFGSEFVVAMQEGFYKELLCLGDACRLPGVQHRIKHMLGMLPTDQRLLQVLRSALTSERPAEVLKPLLEGSGSLPVQPTRLLYTLEVCYASCCLST